MENAAAGNNAPEAASSSPGPIDMRLPLRVRIRRRVFPVFHKKRIEHEYRASIHPHQAHNDFKTASLALCMLSVLVYMAVASGAYKTAADGMVCALCLLVPILTKLTNSGDYQLLRPRIMFFWVLSTSFYAVRASSILDSCPVGATMLPLVLLIRSHVILLFWSNLAMQQPFLGHVLTHGAGLLAVLSTNWWRCRWALHITPLHWLTSCVRSMRLITSVPPPAAGSFTASVVGECTVAVNFLQLLLGYVVPSYIVLMLEVRSRQAFLRSRLDQRRRSRLRGVEQLNVARETRPGKNVSLLSWRMLPGLIVVAAPACWWLAEAAAEHLRATG